MLLEQQSQNLKEEKKEKTEREILRPERHKTKFSNLMDDLGFLEVVETIPTEEPSHPLKKMKIYISGATKRLYIYDNKNHNWLYVDLT